MSLPGGFYLNQEQIVTKAGVEKKILANSCLFTRPAETSSFNRTNSGHLMNLSKDFTHHLAN